MGLEKKQIEIIAVSAMFGLLGIVLAWQLWPAAKAPAGKEPLESPGSYREQLQKAEMAVRSLSRLRTEAEELQRKRDAVVKEVSLETDHTWLSRQVNEHAARAGVRDVSQRYLPAAAGGGSLGDDLKANYSDRTWELRMLCGYHELGQFLAGLEGANRFLEVTDISIEGNDPAGQRVVLIVRYLTGKGKEARPPAPGSR
jgi:Tfp pilus assembly protein PilO